jgi:hypothetical protein
MQDFDRFELREPTTALTVRCTAVRDDRCCLASLDLADLNHLKATLIAAGASPIRIRRVLSFLQLWGNIEARRRNHLAA